MEGWATYAVYVVSGILTLYSIGNLSWPIWRDKKVLIASGFSIGLAVTGAVLLHWAPVIAGFALNLVAGKFLREPPEPHPLQDMVDDVQRAIAMAKSGEVDPDIERQCAEQKKLDQERIDEIVKNFFDAIDSPPTSEIGLHPGRWLQDLKAFMVVETKLLKEIVNEKKSPRDWGTVIGGGNADRRAVLEVLHRWLNMPHITPDDGSYLVLDENLTVEFAGHITQLLKRESTRFACFECGCWYKAALDKSEKGSQSAVHAEGIIRYTCPKGHIVYERLYQNRIFRALE